MAANGVSLDWSFTLRKLPCKGIGLWEDQSGYRVLPTCCSRNVPADLDIEGLVSSKLWWLKTREMLSAAELDGPCSEPHVLNPCTWIPLPLVSLARKIFQV